MTYIVRREKEDIDFLKEDKITKHEGTCVENILLKNLLQHKDINYSTDWWMDVKTNNIVKHVLLEITDLDMKIAKRFHYFGHKVFFSVTQVSEAGWNCKSVKFNPDYNIYFHQLKLIKYGRKLKVKNSPDEKNEYFEKSNGLNRLNKVIERFGSTRFNVEEYVKSRIFANYFGSSSIIDFDAFIEYDNRIICFESKQKYPFIRQNKKYFGLNVPERDSLIDLLKKEFEIIHLIIEKPLSSKNESAITLLESNPKLIAIWLYEDSFSMFGGYAPAETSYGGDRKIPYNMEPYTSFQNVGNLNNSNSDIFIKFLKGTG